MKCTFYLICLASLFSISAAVSNGSFVPIKAFPFYVSLTTEDELYNMCGASIISDVWIITAAHCIVDFSSMTKVRSGSSTDYSEGALHDIEKVIVHGDYEYSAQIAADNDIALIKLKNPLEFTEIQNPVKIRSEPLKIGDTVVVVGLGTQGSGHIYTPALKTATLTVSENYTCDSLAEGNGFSKLGYRTNVFCAGGGGTDACSGDSGGPVVLDNELVGVVSYGPNCDGTAGPANAGGYTIVHQYRHWIHRHTGIW